MSCVAKLPAFLVASPLLDLVIEPWHSTDARSRSRQHAQKKAESFHIVKGLGMEERTFRKVIKQEEKAAEPACCLTNVSLHIPMQLNSKNLCIRCQAVTMCTIYNLIHTQARRKSPCRGSGWSLRFIQTGKTA